jgi:hypothetical protein
MLVETVRMVRGSGRPTDWVGLGWVGSKVRRFYFCQAHKSSDSIQLSTCRSETHWSNG